MRLNRFFVFAILIALLVEGTVFAQSAAQRYYQNGRDFDARGRTQEARQAYNEAVSICRRDIAANPSNIESYVIYCRSLYSLERYQETVDAGRAALAIREDMRIVEIMGEAYFYLDNYNESLRSMERYTDNMPNGDRVSTAYFFMAEIYRLTQRYYRAEIAYTAAVHYNPGHPHWWYWLGRVREETGDRSGAANAYSRSLRIQPGFRDADERLRRLQA